jgi:hypothetical protein
MDSDKLGRIITGLIMLAMGLGTLAYLVANG